MDSLTDTDPFGALNRLVTPVYVTRRGACYADDSLRLLKGLPDDCVDLVMTSPPFALLRQKEYGNKDQTDYVDWLCAFGTEVLRVLRDTGSFVLDLGGAYRRGVPVRSLHQYRVLLKLCDEVGYHLAEEFFWHNPAKLPSPIEWVNKRKVRVKDSVDTVWWLAKTEWPKADVRRVMVPYSERMKKLLRDPERFYKPKARPSGHDIGRGFGIGNGGAIPPNLLQIPNTDSNSAYLRLTKLVGIAKHPARFPSALPEFFIKFLTEPGDIVVDVFAGSNTTGSAAEDLQRKWIAMESDATYAVGSALRFMSHLSPREVQATFAGLREPGGDGPADLSAQQPLLEAVVQEDS